MRNQEIDENYFSIGNSTYEEILVKFIEDQLYDYMEKKGAIEESWKNSEVRKDIRYVIKNSPEGKKRLEIFKKECEDSCGIGWNGLWTVKIDEVGKRFNKILIEIAKELAIKAKNEIYNINDLIDNGISEKSVLEILIQNMNASVSEELSHASGFMHTQSSFNEEERDEYFLDFVYLTPKVNAIYLE